MHAILFNHPPSLSASDINLTLPCDAVLWDCNLSEWAVMRHKYHSTPHFFTTLKSFVTQTRSLTTLDPWSFAHILHGLMSVSWNLSQKEMRTMSNTPGFHSIILTEN